MGGFGPVNGWRSLKMVLRRTVAERLDRVAGERLGSAGLVCPQVHLQVGRVKGSVCCRTLYL